MQVPSGGREVARLCAGAGVALCPQGGGRRYRIAIMWRLGKNWLRKRLSLGAWINA